MLYSGILERKTVYDAMVNSNKITFSQFGILFNRFYLIFDYTFNIHMYILVFTDVPSILSINTHANVG